MQRDEFLFVIWKMIWQVWKKIISIMLGLLQTPNLTYGLFDFQHTFSHCLRITCLLTMAFNLRSLLLCSCSSRSVRILVTASDSEGTFGINLFSITLTLSKIACLAVSVSNTAFWITRIFGWISCTTKFNNCEDLLL